MWYVGTTLLLTAAWLKPILSMFGVGGDSAVADELSELRPTLTELKNQIPTGTVVRRRGMQLSNELNYSLLINELRGRLIQSRKEGDDPDKTIREAIRHRLAFLLDADPHTPLTEIIDQLADKWQQDGLI